MSGTVRELLTLLDNFLPMHLPIYQAISIVSTIAALHPLLRLHRQQRTEPRQPKHTAWLKRAAHLLRDAFHGPEDHPLHIPLGDDEKMERAEHARMIALDLDVLYEFLGLDDLKRPLQDLLVSPTRILITSHRTCILCHPDTRLRSLRLHYNPQPVQVLGGDLQWTRGVVFVAHCRSCGADYYPDRITYKSAPAERLQQLEYGAAFLRISKHGLWCERRIALMQKAAVRDFRAGWSNFANWLNRTVPEGPRITHRQSQRLFMEHFARRLLVAHGHSETFTCPPNLKMASFSRAVRDIIGKDGGTIISSLHHGCTECTHLKRYRSDLIEEGALLEEGQDQVVGVENSLAAGGQVSQSQFRNER